MNDTAPAQQRMEQLAHEFPVNEEWLWANHAAISPWPRSTREAVSAFALENQNQGAVDYGDGCGMKPICANVWPGSSARPVTGM